MEMVILKPANDYFTACICWQYQTRVCMLLRDRSSNQAEAASNIEHTSVDFTGAQTHLRTAVLSCLYVICEMLTCPAPIAKVYDLALSS